MVAVAAGGAVVVGVIALAGMAVRVGNVLNSLNDLCWLAKDFRDGVYEKQSWVARLLALFQGDARRRERDFIVDFIKQVETDVRRLVPQVSRARFLARLGVALAAIIGILGLAVAGSSRSLTLTTAGVWVFLVACVIQLMYAARLLRVVSARLALLRALVPSNYARQNRIDSAGPASSSRIQKPKRLSREERKWKRSAEIAMGMSLVGTAQGVVEPQHAPPDIPDNPVEVEYVGGAGQAVGGRGGRKSAVRPLTSTWPWTREPYDSEFGPDFTPRPGMGVTGTPRRR